MPGGSGFPPDKELMPDIERFLFAPMIARGGVEADSIPPRKVEKPFGEVPRMCEEEEVRPVGHGVIL
jgi:hypothetical protein